MPVLISSLEVKDIRFPTSLEGHGSDAMHTDPDYSCAYVIIGTNVKDGLFGHGPTFTCGRGTEVICQAVKALSPFVLGQDFVKVVSDFGGFWRTITSESQLRWIGPEKGVIHLACAAILNALWDLYGKREQKPVWKLLTDMTPEQIVSCIDFRYITDVVTKEEAIEMLQKQQSTKKDREKFLQENGYPAYTTSTAWLGYSDDTLREKCKKALSEGWTRFKMKVGANLEDDKRRAELVREEIGWQNTLMMDSNQRWDVPEAITWMKELAQFKPLWIEEPTSPDDILGHATIAKALNPLGIGVATGEMCQNRVVFKQMLQAGSLQFLQIDSCRVGSVNELLAILLMAKKFDVPVCPHAGGVLLCELVHHISMFDYCCVSGTMQNRVIEFVEHLRDNFVYPVKMKGTNYLPPQEAGYSSELTAKCIEEYEYPSGRIWTELIESGKFKV